MEELEQIVLEVLAQKSGVQVKELETLTMRALGRPIDSSAYKDALSSLQARKLLSLSGSDIRRTEPDFPERLLETPVEQFLSSKDAFSYLRLEADFTVWQRTARGGRAGTGIWSRPDFTIATIRRRKYDPVRHLDLIALELKNLAGSTVVAVHEALAHARFAHYAYLVCPRSVMTVGIHTAIEDSCLQHGVGLITFETSVGPNDTPSLTNFEFEVDARRQSPEPDAVDNYIDDRLDDENRARLMKIAAG
mgnify:FL=1|tara:strand:- start:266 stop:1012 length:747 start_codon:yes stop_codon:yes gene_type:complete